MLAQLTFRLFAYLRHRKRNLISSMGYGIHSPFAFALVTELINDRDVAYYCFDEIEKRRYHCLNDYSKLNLKNGESHSVASLCKRSSSPAADAQLLFKLGILNRSTRMIELGTFLGFGTSYLASISTQARVISIDHDPETIAYAAKNLRELDIENVELINDSIIQAFPLALERLESVDLIFFDGHHTHQATLDYFAMALPYINAHTVFVFHDIHWSKGMYAAWQQIVQQQNVRLSIERYNMGIIFFDSHYQKLHYFA